MIKIDQVVNSILDAILHRFRDTAAEMSKIDSFPYPTGPLLFRLKFVGVSFGVDPSCWGLHSAESEKV